MSAALDTFAARLPKRPYASDDPQRRGVRVMSRDRALAKKYIQIGSQIAIGYLTFDLDFAGAANAHHDADLPPPTITAVNPKNRHAHVLYELGHPITAGAPSSAVRFAAAVEEALRVRLGGDPGYSGMLVKNPLHPNWIVIAYDAASYTLRDLADAFEPRELRRCSSAREISGLGRNCALFDVVRWWAYRQVMRATTYDEFYADVAAYTRSNNGLTTPLPEREIRSISKSIARWVWERRPKFVLGVSGVRRGALGFAPMPPVMEATKRLEEIRSRMIAGAHHVHAVRRDATAERVSAAVETLRSRAVLMAS